MIYRSHPYLYIVGIIDNDFGETPFIIPDGQKWLPIVTFVYPFPPPFT